MHYDNCGHLHYTTQYSYSTSLTPNGAILPLSRCAEVDTDALVLACSSAGSTCSCRLQPASPASFVMSAVEAWQLKVRCSTLNKLTTTPILCISKCLVALLQIPIRLALSSSEITSPVDVKPVYVSDVTSQLQHTARHITVQDCSARHSSFG